MHTANEVIIHAPLDRIFDVTTDLARWPDLLPHYRFVNFLSQEGDRCRVVMAARRGRLPISWTSDVEIDREKKEMRFTHLKKWTKGMVVVWHYTPQPDGRVKVQIVHDLNFRWPPLAPVAEPVIGGFFIEHVANKTLNTFKDILEKESGSPDSGEPLQT